MVTATLTIKKGGLAEYEDDDLYERARGRSVVAPLGGDDLTRSTVDLLTAWVGRPENYCGRDELEILGRHLYTIAFGGSTDRPQPATIHDAFRETYDRFVERRKPKERLRLRLVIEDDDEKVNTYPWEFVFAPFGGGSFAAGESTELILTRFVPKYRGGLETSDERLRILVVRSEPKSPLIGTVSGASTFKTIAALAADGAEVIPLETPTQKEFEEAMTSDPSPHIVHFIGHGLPNKIALRKSDQELDKARLDLQKRKALRQSNGEEVDEASWIDSRTVCTLLAGENPPRLVFLHACHGASAAHSERTLRGLESVARDLAYTGRIGAVIAMQYAIQNTEADLFATTFYAKLREGLDVDDAVARARRELGTRPGRNAFDDRVFGTPVIYVGNAAPIVRAVRGGGESSKAMPKVGCPNPQCQSYVKRGDPECLVCEKRLMNCPTCATGVVCADIRSRCNAPRCDFVMGPAAPGAPAAHAEFEPPAPRGDDEDAKLPQQSDTV